MQEGENFNVLLYSMSFLFEDIFGYRTTYLKSRTKLKTIPAGERGRIMGESVSQPKSLNSMCGTAKE